MSVPLGAGRERFIAALEPLSERGYAVVDCSESPADYRDLSERLGRVIDVTDVRLRDNGHTYLTKSGPVPPHTDHPSVRWIGWLCVEQDGVDGASQLIDAFRVLDGLGAEAEHLKHVYLGCPSLKSTTESYEWPILSDVGGQRRVYWSPWQRNRNPQTEAAERSLIAFSEGVWELAAKPHITVRLGPGQALFIDNGRMLHARGPLGPASRRKLLRYWIR